MEQLTLFFSKIKEFNFWQRIFSWTSLRTMSYDAYEEFKSIEKKLNEKNKQLEVVNNHVTKLQTEKEGLVKQFQEIGNQMTKKDGDLSLLNHRIDSLNSSNTEMNKKLPKFESTEEERARDYHNKIAQLNQAKKDLDSEKSRLTEERLQEQQDQFDKMKKQWTEHEADVEQTIRMICQTKLIKYVEKVPFKGSPDNTIEICDEYIIFDAKSPANDDLTNFPKYVKAQADNVEKYANQESVRKDIFLVVPSNTIEIIAQVTFNLGDYNVYVITKDSLEPVILSLKKIEEYEFAEQLSPEERDNICRVIGKFAHTTKRKIQVDQFFNNQFIELLVKCANDLPDDFVESILEFEKAEKLNPPPERRTKLISTKELKEKNELINAEAHIRKIEIPSNFEEVKELG